MVQLDTEHIHLRRSSVCNLRDEKKHRRETSIVRDERPRVNFEKRYRRRGKVRSRRRFIAARLVNGTSRSRGCRIHVEDTRSGHLVKGSARARLPWPRFEPRSTTVRRVHNPSHDSPPECRASIRSCGTPGIRELLSRDLLFALVRGASSRRCNLFRLTAQALFLPADLSCTPTKMILFPPPLAQLSLFNRRGPRLCIGTRSASSISSPE